MADYPFPHSMFHQAHADRAIFISTEQRPSSRVFTRQFDDYDDYGCHSRNKFLVRHHPSYDPPPRRWICPHMRNDLYHTAAQVPTGLFSKDTFEYSPSLVGLPPAQEPISDKELTLM